MGQLIHGEITEQILGAAFAVHSALGPGFLERIHEEAMYLELGRRGLQVERQVRVPVRYAGEEIGTQVLDMVVGGEVVVELKAVAEVAEIHKAVVLSYLAAAQRSVALILNFGQPSLKFKRIVRLARAQ